MHTIDEFLLDAADILVSPSRLLIASLQSVPVPNLRCDAAPNELFQMTHKLRNDDDKLDNSKIEKFLNSLRSADYELDDQARSRVFKGRFSRLNSPAPDPTDIRLEKFLDTPEDMLVGENKENMPPPKKHKRTVKRKTQIPVLQPRASLNHPGNSSVGLKRGPGHATGAGGVSKSRSSVRLPNRVCLPHLHSRPGRPLLKRPSSLDIFVVDSLTGATSDATQFGTELNATNCEGFPLPEGINEIVQIPTNDASGTEAQKMAIIKAYRSRGASASADFSPRKRGFYTKSEFDTFCHPGSPEVHVYSDRDGRRAPGRAKTVRWADELEW